MIRVFTMKAVGKDFLAASWSPYLTEERKKLADRKKGERERQLFLGAEVLLKLKSAAGRCQDSDSGEI